MFGLFISLIIVSLFTFKFTFNKYSEFFFRIQVAEKNSNFFEKFENIKYFAHYETAISIFKNNPILGVGNKNFRQECKKKNILEKISNLLKADVVLIHTKYILRFCLNKDF